MKAPRFRVAPRDGEREREVGKMWHWMARAQRHRHRRQIRLDLLDALSSELRARIRRQVVPLHQTCSVLLHLTEARRGTRRLSARKLVEHRRDDLHLLRPRESVVALLATLFLGSLSQPRHPDHEKLVQVRAHDRQELQSLEQWSRRALGE